MFLTSSEIRHHRMTVCKNCKHYVETTKSCGPLARPKYVTEDGYRAKLCGCVMPVKTKLKASKCPLDKWDWVVSPAEIEQLRSTLGVIGNSVTGAEIQSLFALWNQLSGQNRTATNCRSCIQDVIRDLEMMLAQVDEQAHKSKVVKKPRRTKKK